MKRMREFGVALLPLVAVLGLLAPPPPHSHAEAGPVPVAISDFCAGGGIVLHAAHTHNPALCPACAAGPAPSAAPAHDRWQVGTGVDKASVLAPAAPAPAQRPQSTCSRAPPTASH